MTTFIIKRDVVWIESLPTSDTSAKIGLHGKDGCQVVLPAVVLLATSPLVRSILTDHHFPVHSPLCLSLPAATEDVLHAVSDILATGTAADVNLERVNKVKEVFNMLRIEVSVDQCQLVSGNEEIEVSESETDCQEQSEIVANHDVKNEISFKRVGDENEDNKTSTSVELRNTGTNLYCSMEDGEYIEDYEKMEKEERLSEDFDIHYLRQQKQPSAVGKERRTSVRPSMDICVEDETAAAAFGHPIPSLPRTAFTLPWDVNAEDSHDENVKEYSSRRSRSRPMTSRQMPNKRHISYFCPHCHQRFSSWLEKSAHARQMSCYQPLHHE